MNKQPKKTDYERGYDKAMEYVHENDKMWVRKVEEAYNRGRKEAVKELIEIGHLEKAARNYEKLFKNMQAKKQLNQLKP